MIDLHAHILPGLDDGPPTTDAALAMARAAVAAGTRAMATTSHVGHARASLGHAQEQIVQDGAVEVGAQSTGRSDRLALD